MRLRRAGVLATAIAIGLVVGATIVISRRIGSHGALAARPSVSTGTVARRDLVERMTVDGTLGYADVRTLFSQLAGIVTALPRPGRLLERGDLIARVAQQPVVLFYGAVPAWRRLEVGIKGADVRQLELNLRTLGLEPGAVDGYYDGATAAAVARLQQRFGVNPTGELDLGEAVFELGPRRVAKVTASLGLFVGRNARLLTTSSLQRVVELTLSADRVGLVHRGQGVQVRLPTGSSISGSIASVGTVATAPSVDAPPSLPVTIAVAGARLPPLDQAPVTVGIETARRRGVLSVPVKALLALAGGGYAVNVISRSHQHLVGVQPGVFADGFVEISGSELRPGTRVTVAQ